MVCRYCGLDTGSGVGHRSQVECIEALSDEIARAKRLISSFKETPTGRERDARRPHAEVEAVNHSA